nr:hypothetical protein [Tanacetum cinerariifolium]
MATTIEQQVALDESLVVYDVLRRCPFFKAFLVTADVLEIYMQEFWATAYDHQQSIRFKMDTRKNIVDLEAFWDMLHISPRIKTLTDVNVNKLYQPWRSFAAVINKCLTGKSSGIDSLRDDILFSTIKMVSRHQNTQQYSAIQPIELTTEDIRNTKAYKEYYAYATREAAPKPKASARRKSGGSASSTTPPTPIVTPTPITTVVAAPRLTTAAKGKQPARATNKGTGSKPGVLDVPSDDSDDEISWNSSDDEDVDDQKRQRHKHKSTPSPLLVLTRRNLQYLGRTFT